MVPHPNGSPHCPPRRQGGLQLRHRRAVVPMPIPLLLFMMMLVVVVVLMMMSLGAAVRAASVGNLVPARRLAARVEDERK